MFTPWMKLVTDTTLLAVESHAVINLRVAQFALGMGTPAEASRMVLEKVFALAEAAGTAATGGSAERIVAGYRRRVRENVKRLAY